MDTQPTDRLVRDGVKVKVPTTVNPRPGYDFALANRLIFHGQPRHERQLEAFSLVCL